MSITKIHGFERDLTDFGSATNQFKVKETVLVEAASPLTTLVQVVAALPSYSSGPGTVSFNPLQLTFSLNQSYHPEAPLYYLESVQGMRRTKENDRFWHIPLTYSSPLPVGVVGIGFDRRDQKVEKPDSANPNDKTPITNPVNRPPIFTSSPKIINRSSFFDRDGHRIYHTNGLFVSSPVSIPVAHELWTWTWNVPAATYNRVNFDLGNKFNINGFFIHQGTSDLFYVSEKKLKCHGFSINEVWETPSSSTIEYHYVRISGTFEYSAFDTWDNPPVSMHTKGLIEGKLEPIPINEKGQVTKEPWPLKPDGSPIPYDELGTTEPGVLQANDADLVMGEGGDFGTFFSTHKLRFPSLKA